MTWATFSSLLIRAVFLFMQYSFLHFLQAAHWENRTSCMKRIQPFLNLCAFGSLLCGTVSPFLSLFLFLPSCQLILFLSGLWWKWIIKTLEQRRCISIPESQRARWRVLWGTFAEGHADTETDSTEYLLPWWSRALPGTRLAAVLACYALLH